MEFVVPRIFSESVGLSFVCSNAPYGGVGQAKRVLLESGLAVVDRGVFSSDGIFHVFSSRSFPDESCAVARHDHCPVLMIFGNGISNADRAVTNPAIRVQPEVSVIE